MNLSMAFPRYLALTCAVSLTVAAFAFLTAPSAAVADEPGCVPGQLFPAVALQPGGSVRVSVTDTGQHGEAPVWGIRLRDAGGKVVASKELVTPPRGSASLQYAVPLNTTGDPRQSHADVSAEIFLVQGKGEGCSGPLTSLQGFDKDGRTAFMLAEWPPNPWRDIPPTEGDIPPTPMAEPGAN